MAGTPCERWPSSCNYFLLTFEFLLLFLFFFSQASLRDSVDILKSDAGRREALLQEKEREVLDMKADLRRNDGLAEATNDELVSGRKEKAGRAFSRDSLFF